MTNLPFGFANSGDDGDDDKKGSNPGGSGPENPFGAADLGAMLTQLGQMLSGMGGSMGKGQAGPVNYEVAGSLARQSMGRFTPVSDGQRRAVADAVHLVGVWLDGSTAFPDTGTVAAAWTPVDWLEKTMPTWRRLCDPIAEAMSGAMAKGMPEEARAAMGPLLPMLAQMGGMSFGTQLGQGLGQLSKEVLTSTDIGLPLAPTGTAALLPEAVEALAAELELRQQEVLVFLAAREAAHLRLFGHVPWLTERLLSTVEEFARGTTIDFQGIEAAASQFDPSKLMDPNALNELLAGGSALEPKATPQQENARRRLETLLALIEGWVEVVVTSALADRIPSAAALTETIRRRRATGGPAEQTFATLVGLQLRPRELRAAAVLWQRVGQATTVETRDGVWAHPDLIPDSSDLGNPAAFIDRLLTPAGDDPFAEWERALTDAARESENGGSASDTPITGTGRDGSPKKPDSTPDKDDDQD